jgi:ABC-type transport system involved in cytochrome c biogenesis permease subunit
MNNKLRMGIKMNKTIHLKYKTVQSIPILLVLTLIAALTLPLFGDSGSGRDELALSDPFRQMVILEHGRKKPLDTFAQNVLKQFSSRSRFGKLAAIQWLARVLFTPEESYNDKVFLVTNPEVLDSMGVAREGKARDRYNFKQLQPGLTKLRQLAVNINKIKAKDRSLIENEIFALYSKLYLYQQLTASFQFIFPHSDFTINNAETLSALGLPETKKVFSLFEIFEKKEKLLAIITAAEQKNREEWTAVEKDTINLSRGMMGWSQYYRDLPLTIIPGVHVEKGDQKEKWDSPWTLLTPGKESTGTKKLVLIRDFVLAYLDNKAEPFEQAVKEFNSLIWQETGESFNPSYLATEVFYNKMDPFYKCKFFYGFSAIFLLLSYMMLQKWFYRLGFLLLGVGFVLHLWGVVVRMIIMSRPPVTNLYETFVFTGLITALLGIILELFKKKNVGILTGSLAGLVMLMIAGKYALEGDTMGMLVAVLDSNFWLAFHVTTIILGYAGVVLSGFIGHVYLLQRIFKPTKTDLLKNTFQSVYAIQAFGIIFTFLGTVLGGIWADQSWGRFWGWDPKENGALLILLWSAILFHARLANWIKEIGFALGAVIGNITVAMAWFGVNLLGVGLHSYGFTSGVANTLFLFVVVELLFVFVTGFLLKVGGAKKSTA